MSKIITWVAVTVVAGLILAATGWNFKATADIPQKYVSKDAQKIFIERNDKDHRKIEEKLDKLIDHLIKGGGDE